MTLKESNDESPQPSEKFAIPTSDPQYIYAGHLESLSLAKREFIKGFSNDNWEDNHRRRNSNLRYLLQIGLFVIVILLNIWWDKHILAMFWQSGRLSTGFHLADSVLIALATTSVANFIALIIIVAKHLYPSHEQKDK